MPKIPIPKDLGFDLTYALQRGVMAPKGTPKDVIDYWAGVFKKAAQDPELKKQFAAKETEVDYHRAGRLPRLVREGICRPREGRDQDRHV